MHASNVRGRDVGRSRRTPAWELVALRGVLALLIVGGLIGTAACGDDNGDDEAVRAPDDMDPEQVATWPDRWCSVGPGISRDELVDVMGEPTSESAESLSWDAFNYQFNAFLNVNGMVRQMDINTIMLSEAEIAELDCEKTRVLE